VGSGTDPVEGSALAAALLHALAARAALTLCTTHQAPLKDIAVRAARPRRAAWLAPVTLPERTLLGRGTNYDPGAWSDPGYAWSEDAAAMLLAPYPKPIPTPYLASVGHGAAQARDARFENASVEFDLATLRPTYRLVWGAAGASNALAVAEGLGFDAGILADARRAAAAPDAPGRAAALQASLAAEARAPPAGAPPVACPHLQLDLCAQSRRAREKACCGRRARPRHAPRRG